MVASGTFFILFVKTFIRPEFAGIHNAETFLMGITPNLLGSFLLPVGLFMFPKTFSHTYHIKSLQWFASSCFIALCINETLQLVPVFGRTFDWNDIMASAFGLVSSLYFINYFFIPQKEKLSVISK